MSEVSEAQLAANRANATHSTGPKTEEGQKRSSLNAMRHGLTGRTVLLPREKRQAYDAFSQEIFNQLKPASPMEREVVQLIVAQQWRLRRAEAIENALMGMDPEGPAEIEIDANDVVRQMGTLQIYVQRIHRVLKDAQKQLEGMQCARQLGENQKMASLLAAYSVRVKQGVAWDPRDDGFDCSLDELKARFKRDGLPRFARMAEQFGWNPAKMQALLDLISGKEVA